MVVSTVIQNSTYLANSTNFSQIQTINVNIPNDSPYIAILALSISLFSIIIGALSFWIQRKHNRLSVRPLAAIEVRDLPRALPHLPREITLTLSNNGTGPMIIKSIETQNRLGEKRPHPADWIPKRNHYQRNF